MLFFALLTPPLILFCFLVPSCDATKKNKGKGIMIGSEKMENNIDDSEKAKAMIVVIDEILKSFRDERRIAVKQIETASLLNPPLYEKPAIGFDIEAHEFGNKLRKLMYGKVRPWLTEDEEQLSAQITTLSEEIFNCVKNLKANAGYDDVMLLIDDLNQKLDVLDSNWAKDTFAFLLANDCQNVELVEEYKDVAKIDLFYTLLFNSISQYAHTHISYLLQIISEVPESQRTEQSFMGEFNFNEFHKWKRVGKLAAQTRDIFRAEFGEELDYVAQPRFRNRQQMNDWEINRNSVKENCQKAVDLAIKETKNNEVNNDRMEKELLPIDGKKSKEKGKGKRGKQSSSSRGFNF